MKKESKLILITGILGLTVLLGIIRVAIWLAKKFRARDEFLLEIEEILERKL